MPPKTEILHDSVNHHAVEHQLSHEQYEASNEVSPDHPGQSHDSESATHECGINCTEHNHSDHADHGHQHTEHCGCDTHNHSDHADHGETKVKEHSNTHEHVHKKHGECACPEHNATSHADHGNKGAQSKGEEAEHHKHAEAHGSGCTCPEHNHSTAPDHTVEKLNSIDRIMQRVTEEQHDSLEKHERSNEVAINEVESRQEKTFKQLETSSQVKVETKPVVVQTKPAIQKLPIETRDLSAEKVPVNTHKQDLLHEEAFVSLESIVQEAPDATQSEDVVIQYETQAVPSVSGDPETVHEATVPGEAIKNNFVVNEVQQDTDESYEAYEALNKLPEEVSIEDIFTIQSTVAEVVAPDSLPAVKESETGEIAVEALRINLSHKLEEIISLLSGENMNENWANSDYHSELAHETPHKMTRTVLGEQLKELFKAIENQHPEADLNYLAKLEGEILQRALKLLRELMHNDMWRAERNVRQHVSTQAVSLWSSYVQRLKQVLLGNFIIKLIPKEI